MNEHLFAIPTLGDVLPNKATVIEARLDPRHHGFGWVLARTEGGEYATWAIRLNDLCCFSGSYHREDLVDAATTYATR